MGFPYFDMEFSTKSPYSEMVLSAFYDWNGSGSILGMQTSISRMRQFKGFILRE